MVENDLPQTVVLDINLNTRVETTTKYLDYGRRWRTWKTRRAVVSVLHDIPGRPSIISVVINENKNTKQTRKRCRRRCYWMERRDGRLARRKRNNVTKNNRKENPKPKDKRKKQREKTPESSCLADGNDVFVCAEGMGGGDDLWDETSAEIIYRGKISGQFVSLGRR